MAFRDLLHDACDVLRRQTTTTDTGWAPVTETTWLPIASDVPCNRYSTLGTEVTATQEVVTVENIFFNFLPDVDITPQDRLLSAGQTLEIRAVNPVHGHHLTVQCRRIA